MWNSLKRYLLPILEKKILKIDKLQIRRTNNLQYIPSLKNRRGGKVSYGEWSHVIGIFQTIFCQELKKPTGNHMLDIGTGTGILGLASLPFTSDEGSFTGMDVMKRDVDFCNSHYDLENYNFIHFDVFNATYATEQKKKNKNWPVQDNSYDLVSALSVWTHLNEDDSIYYFKEVARVLKPGGKAVITFFYLDQDYQDSLDKRSDAKGRYHSTQQKDWIFKNPSYESENWFHTDWANDPEDAIGVTPKAMEKLLKESGLKLHKYYPGNWKEKPGVYFQDVFVLEK